MKCVNLIWFCETLRCIANLDCQRMLILTCFHHRIWYISKKSWMYLRAMAPPPQSLIARLSCTTFCCAKNVQKCDTYTYVNYRTYLNLVFKINHLCRRHFIAIKQLENKIAQNFKIYFNYFYKLYVRFLSITTKYCETLESSSPKVYLHYNLK